jgi:ribonucleotide reductase alpha subunit
MIMRVSIAVHLKDKNVERIIETYNEMSSGKFTHASPTLFNAGSEKGNLSSCFLLHMDDSMEHIYETNKRCALISKHGGGIGIDISSVRAKGSPIHSTNGQSDGILPMCKVLNATACYSNQSGKRKGSFAVYLQPWHSDIFEFLALRLNNPPEELRARDLFLAMWIPDIFMKRVEEDSVWSLFCPSTIPKLTQTYGEEFESIYTQAEHNKLFTKQVKARDVWKAILQSQIETGLPYIAYKDSINNKSNQKNIGIIRSSNLCMEVVSTIKVIKKILVLYAQAIFVWKSMNILLQTALLYVI